MEIEENDGFCYTVSQALKEKELLESITDSSIVHIVLEKDEICSYCDVKKDKAWEEACIFPDSLWDAKKILGRVYESEKVSVRHLKEQYYLWKRYKGQKGWKSIIINSHERYRARLYQAFI